MAERTLDVAAVGAGVIGLAIARELTSRGVRVAVFERSGIGAGASGVQPGGIRQQWGTSIACRLARESAAFYAEGDERLDPPSNETLEILDVARFEENCPVPEPQLV